MEESEGDAGRTRVVRDECAKVLKVQRDRLNVGVVIQHYAK
jgi:hypothetical protein